MDMFDGSFKIYVDAHNSQQKMDDIERGGHGNGNGNDPYVVDMFSKEVQNVREDMKDMEQLYTRLQECNEEIKTAENAKIMKELRAQLNMDLDHILKLAKQINKKFDGLVLANAAQRKLTGNGPDPSDDHRASMISNLGEDLKHMMRSFQGLRTQMESDHRQIIESRFYAITREKATAESIDNLIANDAAESPLHQAMQEHGRAVVLDAVAEIQERRDTMRDIRRNLMSLHQILLGIATPIIPEGQGGGNRGGGAGPPSPGPVGVDPYPVVPPPVLGGGKTGTGGLNDYEKETRKQAYIAIALALCIISIVVVSLLQLEAQLESKA
ncbi:syntaxin [Sesamum alatum]|uniref:Syntaxin n=1 Tax=Sesamum alatum TaxID=300844 RepID=A0AAE1YZR2_9LAMI|nr:syntaxin [Sesamum alatum]